MEVPPILPTPVFTGITIISLLVPSGKGVAGFVNRKISKGVGCGCQNLWCAQSNAFQFYHFSFLYL